MEYISRIKNLENYTIRHIPDNAITFSGSTPIINKSVYPWYGTIPDYKIDDSGNFILVGGNKVVNTIDIRIFLRQDLDDMGLFTDTSFIPLTSTPPINITDPVYPDNLLYLSGYSYTTSAVLTSPTSVTDAYTNFGLNGRIPGATLNFYTTPPTALSGYTDDSSLKSVSSLRIDPTTQKIIYVELLNVAQDPTVSFNGIPSGGLTPNYIKYIIGGKVDILGNYDGVSGMEFTTYKNEFVKSTNELGEDISWLKTTFQTMGGGWNNNNISLSALNKQEEFLGMVFKPEVSSDVFIDRGIADIFERHALLSELKTTDDIDNSRAGWLTVE
jgi:hypothetical protein